MANTSITETCFRCGSTLDDNTPSPDTGKINFYFCKNCRSAYAKGPGEKLHDRWLMPLSVVLYPVIFADDPCAHAARVARLFIERKGCDIARLKQHILDEIQNPKQQVSQILNFVFPDEQLLRKYLIEVVENLEMMESTTPSQDPRENL